MMEVNGMKLNSVLQKLVSIGSLVHSGIKFTSRIQILDKKAMANSV